jgi:hypothetical protein
MLTITWQVRKRWCWALASETVEGLFSLGGLCGSGSGLGMC